MESQKNLDYKLQEKLNFKVVESCFSFSKKGTLRGIYIQTGKMMEKNNYFVKWKSELVYNELQK